MLGIIELLLMDELKYWARLAWQVQALVPR